MSQKVRWEDVDVRIYVDDVEFGPFAATSFQSDSQMDVDRAKYQGRTSPSLDSSYGGERGSARFTLDDQYRHPGDAFGLFKAAVIERSPIGRVRIIATERVQGGTARRGMRYDNCQLGYSEEKGENQANRVTLSFESENGEAIT